MEGLQKSKICEDVICEWSLRTSKPCAGECSNSSVVCKQLLTGQSDVWFQPRSIEDLLGNIRQVPEHETYRLVGGNTGSGVYDDGGPFRYYIDITKIPGMGSMVKLTYLLWNLT